MWVGTGTGFFDPGRILISCICETNKRDHPQSQPPQVKYGCFRKCFKLSRFQWKLLWSSERSCLRISLPGLHVSWTKKMVILRDFFSSHRKGTIHCETMPCVFHGTYHPPSLPFSLLPKPPSKTLVRRLIPERNMITQSSFSRASRKLPTHGAEVNWPRNRQAVDKEGRRQRVWIHSKQEMKASSDGSRCQNWRLEGTWSHKVTAVSGRREPFTQTHENDFLKNSTELPATQQQA